MKNKNRAAIYMRVSTASQKHDLQKDGLEAYAKRQDWIRLYQEEKKGDHL
jgi:DNA invertase Pin-like site-specific DNA recombinase